MGVIAAVVELLLANKADLHATCEEGFTPLHYASMMGHKKVVKLLLARNADVNAKSSAGATPLHCICGLHLWFFKPEHVRIARRLLKNGAQLNAKTEDGQTPLFLAVKGGLWRLTELLIARGADSGIADKEEKTPLMAAKESGPFIWLAVQGKKFEVELAKFLAIKKFDDLMDAYEHDRSLLNYLSDRS